MPLPALVNAPIADLRASPNDDAELVDQARFHEWVRVLASQEDWAYVQVDEDHYFGWLRTRAISPMPGTPRGKVVASLLAPLYDEPDADSAIVGWIPVGTTLPSEQWPCPEGGWIGVNGWVSEEQQRKLGGSRVYSGFIRPDDVALTTDFPTRPPTADDLLATARAFLGVPYLWGGTTALGMDCSGFVQQVYRLNGIRLDRDAHQQAMEGRGVDVPAEGDLIFFGDRGRVTHVALATSERTFVHAPQRGARVEHGELPAPGRNLLAIRRYLP